MSVTAFGTTQTGKSVRRITLSAGDLTVHVLTWGAVLQSVRLAGVAHDLSPGSETLADYEGDMRHHGSIIGPVVNRLSGAQAVIAGQAHHFEANLNGRHTLHSGAVGTHLQVWDLVEAGVDHATLALNLPDGAGGFPGNRLLTARFSVTAPATLRLELEAASDADTIFNATNHSYWVLDGAETWAGQSLKIAAASYLPTTDEFVPTGEIAPVAGTAHDFRNAKAIHPGQPPLDNCFCLGSGQVAVRDVLELTGINGLRLTVATTEPGVQVYDGRAARRPGHGAYEGFAIETQGWPDAPNKPGFPPIDLRAGEVLRQVTEWRLSKV